MRPLLMIILQMIARLSKPDGQSWPDNWMASRLRILFSRAAARLIVGAVVGLGLGSFSAILGIRLAGIDVRDPSTFNQMVGLVVSFAATGAVILACIFDFTHIYVRFLQRVETRSAHKVLERVRQNWDYEIDSFSHKFASIEKSESLENADSDEV